MTEKNTGGIIRPKRKINNFVMLDKTFINDDRLSWKAKGMLTYLFSKPDDWHVRPKDLAKKAKDGLDAVYSGLKELIQTGYIVREQIREKGKIVEWIYNVYETPVGVIQKETDCLLRDFPEIEDEPLRDFPEMDNPEMANPVQENPRYTNNELTKNELTNIDTTTADSGQIGKEMEIEIPEEFKPGYIAPVIDPALGRFITLFQGEMGRPLSKIECDGSTEIYDLIGEDLARETLKRAVLAGTRNIRYMLKIAREWRMKGIKSLIDLEHEDKLFNDGKLKNGQGNKLQRQGSTKPENSKYDKFYL